MERQEQAYANWKATNAEAAAIAQKWGVSIEPEKGVSVESLDDLARRGVRLLLGVPEAPIGHRQPRPSDLPPETGRNDPSRIDAQDRDLDRAIKNICKGC